MIRKLIIQDKSILNIIYYNTYITCIIYIIHIYILAHEKLICYTIKIYLK